MENEHNYKRPIDEYLSCEDYKNGEGFDKFFREDDKRFYFSYNSASGKTYLRSQGYQNEPGRDNGIDSIIRNSPLDERWFDGYDEEEKYYYFGLKAGNRQEIARSCRYATKEEMQTDYTWVRGEESTIGKGAQEVDGVWRSAASLKPKEEPVKEVEKAAPKRPIDDYLPCEDYANEEGFSKFFREDRNEHYFAFCDDNRKTYLRSEGYTNEPGRDNGINSVIKNAPLDERWVTDTALDGKYHYYALKAGNRQEIARSCYYKDKDEMLADLAWVRGERSQIGKGSKMVGGALMSAFMLMPKPEPVPEPVPVVEPEPIVEPVVKKAAPVAPVVEEKGGCSKWLWWLLPLLLLLLLCYFFCGSCDDKVAPVVAPVVEKVVEAPVAIIEKVLAPGDSFVLEGLNFVYNKALVTKDSRHILDEAIATLKKHKDVKVEIQGHTDNRGNDAYNKSLSQRRANAIKSSLIKSGISSSRLTAVGYGERHPIATNSTKAGMAKNRRIEFKVLD
ncbi:MAG: DUF1508 domain-containing protein [Melioribacteraceae bacterium]